MAVAGFVGAGFVALLFAVSIAGHLARPTQLLDALKAQKLVSAAWRPWIALGTVVAECGLFVVVMLTGLVATSTWTVAGALAGASACLTVYAGYLGVLRVRGYQGACGCGLAKDGRVTTAAVARTVFAASVALGSGVAVVRSSSLVQPSLGTRVGWMCGGAVAALVLLVAEDMWAGAVRLQRELEDEHRMVERGWKPTA